jgi:glycosyltransferase involved in cell wall biosynthesis
MKIAYIMSRFPLLSETFILREMDEVEKQGGEIALYPLICQNQDVVHEEAKKWIPRRNCVPYFSPKLLKVNLQTFFRNPIHYLTTFLKILYWNLPSLKFLIRAFILFPKAILTAEKLQSDNVDHIHCHYATHPALLAYVIHQFTDIPYSITIHSHDIYDNHVMLQQKLEEAEFIITISQFNVKYLEALLGNWIRDKTKVIHCGITPSDFNERPKTEIGNTFNILQIGSLHWKKGQTDLIRAAKLLTEKLTNFKITIVGEGDERKKLEALIDKLELNNYVNLLGAKSQQQVREILPQADCYIQSSVSEGIPVAIMEALASQLPVIATDITGIPEIVIDNQTGYLIPPNNPEALAKAIYHVYTNYKEASGFAQSGQKLVYEEYNLQKNVKDLVQVFHNLDNQGKI